MGIRLTLSKRSEHDFRSFGSYEIYTQFMAAFIAMIQHPPKKRDKRLALAAFNDFPSMTVIYYLSSTIRKIRPNASDR